MRIKIPMIGWFSTNIINCGKCHNSIGHFVSEVDIADNLTFHSDCHVDYIAEKEGWTEYRQKYKSVQRRYQPAASHGVL